MFHIDLLSSLAGAGEKNLAISARQPDLKAKEQQSI
jgi:hypothetical protein